MPQQWKERLDELKGLLNNQPNQPEPESEFRQQATTLQPDPMTPEEVEQGRVYEYRPVTHSIAPRPTIKSFVEETALWTIGLGAVQAVAIKVPVPLISGALKIFLFPNSLLVATIAFLVYGIYAYNSHSLPRMTVALQASIGFMFSLFVIAILL